MFLFSASLCRSFLYSHIICKSKYSTFHLIVKCHVPWGNRMVVSFTTTNYFVNPSLWWPIYVFNSVVNTKLLTNYLAGEDLPLWCFHSAGSVVHIIIANERICKLFIYLKASVADLKLAYLYVEKIIHQQGINNNTLTFPPPLPTPTPSLNDICLKNVASTKMLKKSWYCVEKSRLCAVPSFFWSPLGKLKKYQSPLSPKSDVSTPLNSRKEAHRKIIILADKALSKAGWQTFAWTWFPPTSAFRASVCSGFNGFS